MWLIKIIMAPWRRYQQKRAYKRRLAELRKRDPFIYR
jgi:hypothetical protein